MSHSRADHGQEVPAAAPERLRSGTASSSGQVKIAVRLRSCLMIVHSFQGCDMTLCASFMNSSALFRCSTSSEAEYPFCCFRIAGHASSSSHLKLISWLTPLFISWAAIVGYLQRLERLGSPEGRRTQNANSEIAPFPSPPVQRSYGSICK